MGRAGFLARGNALILSLLGLLLSSCNNAGSTPAQSAFARTAAHHYDIDNTFESPEFESRLEIVANRVASTVVAISATDARLETEDSIRADHLNPEKLAALLEPVDRTVGTGFIVDPDGYIVTNDHVVSSTDNIWVTTDDHKVYPAVVVGSDPRSDLAVLKIPAHHLPTARFAEAPAQRGQLSIALGNPYGLASGGEMALSVGVVSATGRSLPKLSSKEDRLYSDLIQTTAQINPGNSGGPLFDARGEVIGINAAVILPQKTTNGIGFAIPITQRVRFIIDNLKEGREVAYAWLGVRVTSPTPAECRQSGLAEEAGAKIESFEPRSPATASKLQVGDIIASFHGRAVTDSDHFVRLVGEAPIDREVNVVVYRQGKPHTIAVTTARRPAQQVAVSRLSQRMRWKGMLLGPIPEHWAAGASNRPTSGLMVLAIDPASPCLQQGIAQGTIIATVAGKPVSNVLQLQRILNDTPSAACGIGICRTARQIVSVQE